MVLGEATNGNSDKPRNLIHDLSAKHHLSTRDSRNSRSAGLKVLLKYITFVALCVISITLSIVAVSLIPVDINVVSWWKKILPRADGICSWEGNTKAVETERCSRIHKANTTSFYLINNSFLLQSHQQVLLP